MSNTINFDDDSTDPQYEAAREAVREHISENFMIEGEMSNLEIFGFVMETKTIFNEHNIPPEDRGEIVYDVSHGIFHAQAEEAAENLRDCEW